MSLLKQHGNSGWVLAAVILLCVLQRAWCADPEVRAHLGGSAGAPPDLARDFLLDGRWFPEAENAYRAAIQAAPGDVVPWNGLALLLLEAGRNREAAEVLRDTIRAGIGNAYSLALLADLYDTLGLAEQAAGVCAERVRLEGGTPEARVRVAGCYLRMGIPAQARQLAEPLRDDPAAGAALAGLGARILLAEERWPDAADAARNLLKSTPDSLEAWLVLAEALLGSGDAAEALAVLQDVPAGALEEVQAWCLRGAALEALGKAAEAEEAYQAAVQRDATERRALARLGSLSAAGGRWDEAVGWFERALREDPFDPTLQRALGGLLAQGTGAAAERGRRLLALAERNVSGPARGVRSGTASPEATGVQPAAAEDAAAADDGGTAAKGGTQ